MLRARKLTGVCLALVVLGISLLPVGSAQATFPGTNGRIAFADWSTGQIYSVNPDGTRLIQLTHTRPGIFAGDPTWSPDGEHIVFVTNRGGRQRLWIMDAGGRNKRLVADDGPKAFSLDPAYTPDGTRIVYTRCAPFIVPVSGDRVFTCRIYSIGIDGTDRVGLTVTNPPVEVADFAPAVSPDGTSIAFTRHNKDNDGILGQVYVMGIDGSDPHALTPPELEGWFPDWSPEGTRIAFTSNCCRPGSSGYLMDADGTDIQQLTSSVFPHNDVQFTFSPSGDRMVFASDRSYGDLCCADMFVMNADGTQQATVGLDLHGTYGFSWGTAPTIGSGSTAPTIRPRAPVEARFGISERCSALPALLQAVEGCTMA